MSDSKKEQERQSQLRAEMEAEHARRQALNNQPSEPTPDATPRPDDEVEASVNEDIQPQEEDVAAEDENKNDYVGSQMAAINKNKKIFEENAALDAKEKEEKEKEEKAAAEAEAEKKKEEEAAALLAAEEVAEQQQATIQHNEEVDQYVAEMGQEEVDKNAPKEEESLGKKMAGHTKKVYADPLVQQAEEAREYHMEAREAIADEETGETHFQKHQGKQEKVFEDINKQGESPLEALRRRKAEKEAAKQAKLQNTPESSEPGASKKRARDDSDFSMKPAKRRAQTPLQKSLATEEKLRQENKKISAERTAWAKAQKTQKAKQFEGQLREAKAKLKPVSEAPSIEARAQIDRNEQHLNVTPELKKQMFVNDDRKAEMDEAGGGTANKFYTQTEKTVKQIDTPEEIQENRSNSKNSKNSKLEDSAATESPAKRVAQSPPFQQYAKDQKQKQQEKSSTPTPQPGHRTAPDPTKK